MSQNSRVGAGVEKFRGAGLDLLLLFLGCALGISWMYTRAWSPETRFFRAQFVEAQIVSGGGLLLRAGLLFTRRAGETTRAVDVLSRARILDPEAGDAIERLLFFAVVGGCVGGAVLYPFVRGLRRGKRDDKHLRGARIVPAWRLRARLEYERLTRLSSTAVEPVRIGALPVPRELEPFHFLIGGGTGTGKSQLILSFLDAIRARKERAIITDIGCNLMSVAAARGDRLLNPFDSRSARWSPFSELRESADARALANAIIQPKSGEAGEWRGYAQTFFSVILKKLKALLPQATNADLCRYLASATVEELAALAEGTTAARAFAPGAERARDSVLFTLGLLSEAFEYLDPDADSESFSIRKWVDDETKPGWLWIPYAENRAKLMQPFLAAWVDVAVTAALSLRPDRERRIWLVMDEMASLGCIPALEAAVTKGRKFGLVVVGGVQDVAQVRANYHRESAQTILGNLRNLVSFNVADPESAKYMSERLGDEEIVREEESRGKGGSTVSTRRSQHQIVLPSELQNLPSLTAYVNLAGDYPVSKIRTPYRARPERIKPFIPRGEA